MLSPLYAIDSAVKAHEWAHLMMLGPHAAGPIQYDFVIDAEGNRYAVGGSIAVDLSPVPGDPEATIRKAKAVLQAAYAPGNPSAADVEVAEKALALLRQAEKERAAQEAAALEGSRASPETKQHALPLSTLYSPDGSPSSWYDFWFQKEPSSYREIAVSLWV